MRRSLLGLLNRKLDLKSVRTAVSARAVCAVILGAQVRRLDASRFRGGVCEIESFDELPLFSKLIIYLTGQAVKVRIGFAADDRVDLARATALASEVAPSRQEVEQLLRLAKDEAARIIGQRWTIVQNLAEAVAQRGELKGVQVSRIVHHTRRKRPPLKHGLDRAGGARPTPRRTHAAWVTDFLSRCMALLGTGTDQRSHNRLSDAPPRTDVRTDAIRSSDAARES